MPPDVLEHDERRAYDGDRISDVRPYVPVVLLAEPTTCLRKRLARIPGRDDVYVADPLRPVGGGDVAEVGDSGVAVGEDFAGALVDVGDGDGFCSEHVCECQIDAAVAGTQTHVLHDAHLPVADLGAECVVHPCGGGEGDVEHHAALFFPAGWWRMARARAVYADASMTMSGELVRRFAARRSKVAIPSPARITPAAPLIAARARRAR